MVNCKGQEKKQSSAAQIDYYQRIHFVCLQKTRKSLNLLFYKPEGRGFDSR
jgi:hypothetical protein